MGIFKFALPLDEEPIKIVRNHWVAGFKVLAKIVITGLILFAVLFFVFPFWWQTYYGRIGIFVFLIFATIFLVKDVWKKFSTFYIITGDKIIDVTQEKILKRVVTEIEMENIEKIKIKKNFVRRRIFGVGDLIFGLKNEAGILVFYNVKNPLEVKKTIQSLIREKDEIIGQKGEECKVVGNESAEEKVPLTVSYYGKKLKERNEKFGKKDEEKEMDNDLEEISLKLVKKNKI